jgi:hypothetical protein
MLGKYLVFITSTNANKSVDRKATAHQPPAYAKVKYSSPSLCCISWVYAWKAADMR